MQCWVKKVVLELISDVDMYLFFGKGMRGLVLFIPKNIESSCCHSNHKYLKFYDAKQELEHIIYFDDNNLYGNAKFLPTGAFKSIDSKGFDLSKYTKNSLKCCVQKVE